MKLGCSDSKSHLLRLYKIGEEKLEKEMDIIKILRTLRYVRAMRRVGSISK